MNISGDKSPSDSPCASKCSTDTQDGICRGCGRTLTEIRCWSSYTREERIQVNREADRRKYEAFR